MKIILAVDAIKPPLTGIGRYTRELANRIPSVPGVEVVRFFSGKRLLNNIVAPPEPSPVRLAAKQQLVRSQLAHVAFRKLSSILLRHRLGASSDHLFHGPNFYLPPFPGQAIATIHDLSIYRYPQFHPPERVEVMSREVPIALRRASFLITDSEFIRQEIINFFGWPEDKVRVVPLGVSDDYRQRGVDETADVLSKFGLVFDGYALCVATIEPRKNIDVMLSAYELLPQLLRIRYPLALVGGQGWRSEAIHNRIEQGQRQGWLRYFGYVSEQELPLLYSGARGFIYPSLYEGFGLPVLEAMASGLPTLISNRASLPELASGAALVVEAEDVHAMAENIQRLFEDEAWRDASVKRSLEVSAQYSWEETARKTVDVYRSVLSSTRNKNY